MNDYHFLFNRHHPLVTRHRESWRRSEKAYSGGAAYIDHALIRHVSEVSPEFVERKKRAYYFNYPRRIARLISQYVLAEEPQRHGGEPALAEDFSRTGLRVSEVIRQLSTMVNCFGTAWVLVDMPQTIGEIDLERQRNERLHPFAITLRPWEVADWSYGNDGRLDWALVEELCTVQNDPTRLPVIANRRRLWTRHGWQLFERNHENGDVQLIAEGSHPVGLVPLVRLEEVDGFGLDAGHWFEDVVRISDAILNAESEAQMNIIKQMFGLLVVSESFRNADFERTPTSDGDKFSHVLARSAALWESTEEKGITRYIAPGGVETSVIREEIRNLKKELYEVVGLAIQGESRQAQTAESKEWDHLNVQQFLASRVDMLEQAELQVWDLMRRWDNSIEVPSISYNREFSVVDLGDSVKALLDLKTLNAGPEFHREVIRAGVRLLEKIKRIPPQTRREIEREIDMPDQTVTERA